jgi:hypothetical protein
LLFFMFIGIRRSICHILGSAFQSMPADRSGSEEMEGGVVLLLKEVPWFSYNIFICYWFLSKEISFVCVYHSAYCKEIYICIIAEGNPMRCSVPWWLCWTSTLRNLI